MTTDQLAFRTALPLALLAFLVVSCSSKETDSTSTETTSDSSVETQVPPLLPHQQMAKDFLHELIEIDTTQSTGSTTVAADAMAAHLIAEGFAAEDVQVMDRRTTGAIWLFAIEGGILAVNQFSYSHISMSSMQTLRTGHSIHSHLRNRKAITTAEALLMTRMKQRFILPI